MVEETKNRVRIPSIERVRELTPEAEDNVPLIASTSIEDIANEPKGTNLITGNKLPPSFAAMQRTGFKFLSYSSSVTGE